MAKVVKYLLTVIVLSIIANVFFFYYLFAFRFLSVPQEFSDIFYMTIVVLIPQVGFLAIDLFCIFVLFKPHKRNLLYYSLFIFLPLIIFYNIFFALNADKFGEKIMSNNAMVFMYMYTYILFLGSKVLYYLASRKKNLS